MELYDLGDYSRPVSGAIADSQQWFDQGLLWTYGYNHDQAVDCFSKATDISADCALAYWGVAYASGPNYNKIWSDFDDDGKRECLSTGRGALVEARKYLAACSEVEVALIEALEVRYPQASEVDDYTPFNDAYADAMRDVYARHRLDLDVCALFAEALMNRTPWQLWDLSTGLPAQGADTVEAIEVLEDAFANVEEAWTHAGLLHMYIHLMEMSPHPERALRHGDVLATLIPGAGHLIHMPTHIDVLCGDYQNVVARNQAATIADNRFVLDRGADNFYTSYRCHNLHFEVYGAMFLGQPEVALKAADELARTIPDRLLKEMADWLEPFVPMRQHVLIRFGRWNEILEQPLPDDAELYSVTTALIRYARTVALANVKRLDDAAAEKERFYEAVARVPDSRMLFNNSCKDLLGIAEQMMLGELKYHLGDTEGGLAHLRTAVTLDDGLPYDEPWGWMQPARHALGALLMEQQYFDEAEAVYRADLGLDDTLRRACQHPDNVWSLHGLHECLKRSPETAESRLIGLKLTKAQARASVPVRASCYCRSVA